jgi:ribosomal protein S18 acetylase RimI-like enzyme
MSLTYSPRPFSTSLVDRCFGVLGRQGRHLRVSLARRGLRQTLYWAAFGYLWPRRFVLLSANTAERVVDRDDVTFALWTAAEVREASRDTRCAPLELHLHEVDHVDLCAVALDSEGMLVGAIWVYQAGDPSRMFHLGDGEAELNYGCVLPSHRRRGIFCDLLRSTCSALREHGVSRVYAAVHDTNVRSLRTFIAAGFVPFAVLRHVFLYRPKLPRRRLP